MQYSLSLFNICFDTDISMVSVGTFWLEREYPYIFVLFELGWLYGNFQLKILNKAICGDYPEILDYE